MRQSDAETTASTLRVGTRGSALARTQTEWVVGRLQILHPGLAVTTVPIATEGDRTQHTNQPSPAWGLGVFVKELETALLDEYVDFAVHSLKDVPPTMADGLAIAAIPEREDPRDALVTRDGRPLVDLPPGARVGTSSARRTAFLRAVRPDVVCLPLRGNVDTRYRKLLDGQYDAILLARAGLARLGMDVPHVLLDPSVLPPAPGQGALALQARSADLAVRRLLEPLNDAATAAAVRSERSLMAQLDAGCRLPLAALGQVGLAGYLSLAGAVAAPDGSRVLRASGVGSTDAPEELGIAVAAQLRLAGAEAVLAGSMGTRR